MSPAEKNEAFAEVIESTLDHFLAQSWEWNNFPSFSSLVQVKSDNYTILGTVTHIETGSMDPMRYPFPYQKTEEELMAEQPQIFKFLKTTFKVQIIGYMDKAGTIYHMLPPKPSKIHAFVLPCSSELISKFFNKPDFLNLLFAFESNSTNLDELLLAILRQLQKHKLLTAERLHDFSNNFSLLTGNDYRRLKLFLSRTQNIIRYKTEKPL